MFLVLVRFDNNLYRETDNHSQLHIHFRVLYLPNICKEMQNVVFLQGKVFSFWGCAPQTNQLI